MSVRRRLRRVRAIVSLQLPSAGHALLDHAAQRHLPQSLAGRGSARARGIGERDHGEAGIVLHRSDELALCRLARGLRPSALALARIRGRRMRRRMRIMAVTGLPRRARLSPPEGQPRPRSGTAGRPPRRRRQPLHDQVAHGIGQGQKPTQSGVQRDEVLPGHL